MLLKKRIAILIVAMFSAVSVFSSEWNNIIRADFTYGGTLNRNQFQQFGTNIISDGIATARSGGMTAVRLEKFPQQVNRLIENELVNYNLSVNDVFVFTIVSNRSLISGSLRIVRKITGLSYEFYAVQVF